MHNLGRSTHKKSTDERLQLTPADLVSPPTTPARLCIFPIIDALSTIYITAASPSTDRHFSAIILVILTVQSTRPGPRSLRLAARCLPAVFCCAAFALAARSASAADRKSLPALFTTDAIVLDGVLDEKVWGEATAGTGFVQREPDTGKAGSQRTEVRVVYTETTLYIGLSNYDNEANRIIDKEMQRDQPLWRDDAVDVVLDTFGDHRNAYLFETNPNGARTDALISDEGRDFNLSWNGVWQVASRRTPEGWFSEMAIPFSTLRFDPAATAWGLNVLRYVRRRAEQAFWSPILLDADVKRVSQDGELTGIRDAKQGWGVNVKPFAVGSLNSSPSPSGIGYQEKNRSDFGLDAKWAPIRAVSVDLTVTRTSAKPKPTTCRPTSRAFRCSRRRSASSSSRTRGSSSSARAPPGPGRCR